MNRWSSWLVVAALSSVPRVALGQAIPAFSGADGAAAGATGGRGGIVYHVMKLDKNFSDNEIGTLRYGLNDANFDGQPRTIVFDVAGTFWLGRFGAENGHDNGWDSQSRLNLGSNVTIAGQTAPGPVNIMGGVVKAGGNNTILRNVTIAPGYGMRGFEKPDEDPPELPTPGDFPDSFVFDALDISGQNIMIDHVSTFYATDETISANEEANNVTIQYSNISQGQNYPQADAEASSVDFTGHALGSLLQGGSNASISVHHNLYAHQKGRLPRVGSEVGTGAYNDFRNNVFYNWFGTAGTGGSGQPSFNNFVGNYYLAGPGGDDVSQTAGPDGQIGTLDDVGVVVPSSGGTNIFNGSNSTGTKVFHSGNLKDTNKDGDAGDGVPLTYSDFGLSSFQTDPLWPQGQATYTGVTDTAAEAFDRVLNYVGARWWERDETIDTLDERIIHEVRTGTGQIVAWADDPFNDDPNEGLQWRSMLALRADPDTGEAPFRREPDWDTDDDGMPDLWEKAHRLDTNVQDHNGDFDDDGYTNLEEYLNEIAQWPAPQPIVFNGATNNRYAQITNWDIVWQPSQYDEAHVNNGTAVVDSVGQHAGTLVIAANDDDDAQVDVTGGWLWVNEAVAVGGTPTAQGKLNLSGGMLGTPLLTKGAAGTFHFTGGELRADVVDFDLVNNGGTLATGHSTNQTHVKGDLTLTSGTLQIALASETLANFLLINGQVTLGGSLDVELLDGFAPENGSWHILSADSITGEFDSITEGFSVEQQGGDLFLLVDGVPTGLPGDYNNDGLVDAADYTVWRDGLGGTFNEDGYAVWKQNFGATSDALGSASAHTVVLEPEFAVLLATGGFVLMGRRLFCTSMWDLHHLAVWVSVRSAEYGK